MDIAVFGHGYVGSAFAMLAAQLGHRVYATKRGWNGRPRDGIVPLAYKFGDERPAELPTEVDTMVFCAAAGESTEQAYRDCYLKGLSFCRQLFVRQPRRLLFTSSTAVYPQSQGEIVTEATPVNPSSYAGRVLLEAENSLNDHPSAVALRLGGLYGPGRDRDVRLLGSGTLKLVAGKPQYTNRIHRDDAAAVLVHLMECTEPERTYNVVDCEAADRNEVVRWLAQQEGLDPVRLETIAASAPSSRGNKRVSNQKLLQSGYQFIYPTFREGLGTLLVEARRD